MKRVGIIGAGNMGEAILANAKVMFAVRICESNRDRARAICRKYHLKACHLKDLVRWADVLVLAVKPQDLDQVLGELAGTVTKDKLVLSIAAGVTTHYLEKKLGQGIKVVRSMPNMPGLIGEGVTAVCSGKFSRKKDVVQACKILSHIGETVVVKEKFVDAITAVSGSGPAYVFLFLELLTRAAGRLGLSENLAARLVEKTFLGSLHLVQRTGMPPSQLRVRVTSKGGTTQAALSIFEKENLAGIFEKALKAASQRAKQLSKK